MNSDRLEQLRIGALQEPAGVSLVALDNVCRLAIARVEFLERKHGADVIPIRRDLKEALAPQTRPSA